MIARVFPDVHIQHFVYKWLQQILASEQERKYPICQLIISFLGIKLLTKQLSIPIVLKQQGHFHINFY